MKARLIGMASLLFAAFSHAADKPNILFLFADDQRADTIGAHGNPHIQTPNLDKLVGAGFSFRANYCFGGNSGAVCVPSRAMLMSGRTWFRVDTATLKDAKLLPELLQENGYVTFATGKWHNGQPSWLRAFQRGKNIMFGGMADHTKVPVRDLGPEGRLTEERTGEKFSSELFADAAIEFLRGYDGKKPFFAYVAFTAPHDPRQPPEAFRESYYRRLPALPPNFLPQLPFDNGMMRGGRDENLAAWPRTEKVVRDQLAEYYGMITHLDGQVGRILDALKQTGHADRTLVIYAADNGLALGSHGLLGKQSVYEHSMRVPLIIAGPGVPQGKSTKAFTYLLDIFPTLCDLLGIQPPPNLDGETLRPLWEGRKDQVRNSVFLPFIQIQRAVRDERWKLICYPRISHLQLFDLQADPDERTNLIARADCAPEVQRLLELMKQWQARAGDTLPLPVENKPPEPVDLTGRKRVPDQWQPDWVVKKYFDAPRAADAPDRPTASGAPAQVVPGSETRATVVFVTRIINRDETPLRAPRIHLHAPPQLPHQDITELEVEGNPERLADGWGSPVLLYQSQQLAPGAALTGRWTAWAAVRRFRWDWGAQVSEGGLALAPEEQTLYLRDGKDLALADPIVAAAAQEAARNRTGTAAVLDGVFGLVMDRLSYDRDGKWQPAPEVLTSGKGSCSEYSYCFIALCRKNGIPARYVGGIVGRTGVPFHLDKIFHRFPQAYIPGRGWVDFDPTRTERAQNKRLYFGQTPGPMLLLSVGDGGEGSLTGADYLEKHGWEDTKARASSLRQAWWFSPPPHEVRTQVAQFRRRLDSAPADEHAALVSQALAIGHPFVLPWLDDLLYQPSARVEAARACLEIGGQGELAAVINCLGRLDDAEGDRQIGQLLDEFTGETIGNDRAKWNEWLKTRTPRTPLPGDEPERKP